MRTFCVPCRENNIKDWKEHERSEKHQAWERSVKQSMNTYQGEQDKDDEREEE